jgi:hypothetical protein
MSSDNSVCVGPAFLAFGLFLIYSGAQRFLLYQKIRNIPTSKVRSAAVGLAELFGKAYFEGDMPSPVSRQNCAYWRIKGEYYKPGKHGGWRDIYNSHSSSQFYLEDDTGRMRVEPEGAEIDIPADFTSAGHLEAGGIFGLFKAKTLDPKVLSFLESNPAARNAFHSHKGYELRLTEYYIAEGDELYILGTATQRAGAASSIGHENLLMKKGGDGIMYVSDSGERKAAEKVRNSMLLTFVIGFVLSAIGLYALLTTFGM